MSKTWLASIENLVLGGGGVRGVSYCGALMALERSYQKIGFSIYTNLKRVSGTSVGALFAVALALRMTGERLFRMMDSECLLVGMVPQMDLHTLNKYWGLDHGDMLRKNIRRVVQAGVDEWTTTRQLPDMDADEMTLWGLFKLTGIFVELSVTRLGHLVHKQRPCSETLNMNNARHVRIVDAVYMSMAVPLLFCPIHFRGGIYTDGGLLNNIPVEGLDPKHTLVLHLTSPCLTGDASVVGYLEALLNVSAVHDEKLLSTFPYILELSGIGLNSLSFNASRQQLLQGVMHGMVQAFWKLHQLHAPLPHACPTLANP